MFIRWGLAQVMAAPHGKGERSVGYNKDTDRAQGFAAGFSARRLRGVTSCRSIVPDLRGA